MCRFRFQGFDSFLSQQYYEFSRVLLFLFHVSHLVVVYNPGHVFDLSYVQLFKAIDACRYSTSIYILTSPE